MTLGRYLWGVLLAAIVFVPLVAAARTLRRLLLLSFAGAAARLGEAILGLSIVIVVAQVLGLAGWFRTAPMVAGLAAVGSLVWVVGRRLAERTGPAGDVAREEGVAIDPRAAAGGGQSTRWVALAATSVLVAAWGAWTVHALRNGMDSIDTRWYHMAAAGRFRQTGSLTALHHLDTSNLTAFYPFNSEVLHALGAMLIGTDVLSPLLNLGWLALALLAGWCIGTPFGVAPVTMAATIALVATPTIITTQAGAALTDIVGLSLLLSAVAVLIVSSARGRWTLGPVLVAGLAAGLAIGVKWTLVPAVGATTIGVAAVATRGSRRASAGAWSCGLVLTGAFWYLRNLVVVGNPIPPLEVEIGPLALPSPPQRIVTSSVSDFLLEGDVWTRVFVPGFADAFGLMWWAVVGLAITGMVAAVALGPGRVPRMLGLVAIAGVGAYVVQPQALGFGGNDLSWFRFNLRYALPALGVGLVLLPLLPVVRRGRWPTLLAAVLGAAVVVSQFASEVWPPGSLGGPGPWPSRGIEVTAGAAIGIVVFAGGALHLLQRRRPIRMRRAALTGLVAAGALGAVMAGFVLERYHLDRRYGRDSTYPESWPITAIYAWARDVRDARIGIVGNTFQYPLYGKDLSNHVQYVARPGPNGSVDELEGCDEWRKTLNEGRYDYVLVAPPPVFTREPPEAMAWTERDPAASVVLRDQGAVLFQLDGELDSDAC
ncbi:MAG: hypothetical protein ACRD07_09790 [Acidimicrobiales bacterium]